MTNQQPEAEMEIDNEEMRFYEPNQKLLFGPAAQLHKQVLGIGLPDICSYQVQNLEDARDFALTVSIQHFPQIKAAKIKQREAHYKQLLSALSRLYICSFNRNQEESLHRMFEVFGPLKNLSCKEDKGQNYSSAFVDYYTPEAAICALNTMNGRELDGRELRIRSYNNANVPQHIIENLLYDAQNKCHRIYVSPIHSDLDKKDLERLFRTYGDIRNIRLMRWSERENSNFAYIQYEDADAVTAAINGMNNRLLYGQLVYVCACLTPPDAHYLLFTNPSNWIRNAQSFSTFTVKHY